MGRPAGERRGEEGGRRGPALQQLLPAWDSPVRAVPPGHSHKAQRGGREHRVPLSGPWGPSWEILASALPSPPPRSPSPGGGNASRAQTPPPPPPPPPQPQRLGACCCSRRGTRWVPSPGDEEAGAERRGSRPAPRRGGAQPARPDGRPARRHRAAPEHLRAQPGPRALSAPRDRILSQKHIK